VVTPVKVPERIRIGETWFTSIKTWSGSEIWNWIGSVTGTLPTTLMEVLCGIVGRPGPHLLASSAKVLIAVG
jgi:hypothetical protein